MLHEASGSGLGSAHPKTVGPELGLISLVYVM
jgi:hypothetical protein